MQEATSESLQIAYLGPATRGGRMPMEALANGLRGQALLVRRVKDLLYGDAFDIDVQVDANFEEGSLIVPVHILHDLQLARDFFAGSTVTAVVNLLTLLGFLGINGPSLYGWFKRRNGRRIESPDDVPVPIGIDLSIERLVKVFNDKEVQEHLRKVLDPLHIEGIDEFQTRRDGMVLGSVSKSDLIAADEAEVEDNTKDEEITLDIEKAAWRRALAWHFSDGTTRFDARIDDENFWGKVEGGLPFSVGDKLRVHLRTTAKRTKRGALRLERRIPKVLEIEQIRSKQRTLFEHG